ncbi:MAG: crotonase/enoyl-CoA hydratase family protein [Gammaproteobacteria bacterium]|nr:crotonase/enoyl-CoA hydratase family protein [Gammaproteobacteria bacterium]MDH3362540.1 crotonase/enoyl-CoA hydratase family protein [Gammaproteobacteria bacterium]MDH3480312.1 crotonase/enoyl-CoA hydratase family protein [Gammaproteobacteria bacterium]
MSDRVSISLDGHVADVMLNRPEKYNALDMPMFEALGEAADELAKKPDLRAVVLHGAGDNFCAGIDIDVFTDPQLRIDKTLMAPIASSKANLFQRAAYAWRELPVPVICALHGITFGGGLQIALGADLRYAAADTRLSIMETKWGLIPDMAISTTLRGVVPPDRVKELAWSARVFDATEALQLGIVTNIHDDPLSAAREFAQDCAARSPDAIRAIKQLVNEAWHLQEAESLALEAKLQLGIMGLPNQVEAVRANLEKRPPRFAD